VNTALSPHQAGMKSQPGSMTCSFSVGGASGAHSLVAHLFDTAYCRDYRISTWNGEWLQKPFQRRNYYALIEDPFDADDNCGRSVNADGLDRIAQRFSEANSNASHSGGRSSQQQLQDVGNSNIR
jgi:hypothetical protein